MNSFLKKMGTVLGTVGQAALTATAFGPLVTGMLGSKAKIIEPVLATTGIIANDLTMIGQAIVTVETALSSAKGEDKLAAAVALVRPVVLTSQMVSGKKVADPAKMEAGIRELTQGVVDILNSLDADSVKTELKQ